MRKTDDEDEGEEGERRLLSAAVNLTPKSMNPDEEEGGVGGAAEEAAESSVHVLALWPLWPH